MFNKQNIEQRSKLKQHLLSLICFAIVFNQFLPLNQNMFPFHNVSLLSQVPFTYIEYDSNARLWPGVRQAYDVVDRYQLVNSYGLFRRMTGVGGRPEVVIEGSNDGISWTVRALNHSF